MIECLQSILLENHNDLIKNNDVKLKDSRSSMEVEITGVPEGGLIFNVPPGGKSHIGVVEAKLDYKKSCDQLIFIPAKDYMDVYFIEMKKTLKPEESFLHKAFNQITSTIPVLDYLVSMAKIHHKESKKIRENYVVIGEKIYPNLSKQSMKPEYPKLISHKKKKFKVIVSSSIIPFSQLRCN